MENPLESYTKIGVVGRGAFGVCYVYRKPRDHNGPPKKIIVKTISMEGYNGMEQEALKEEARLLRSLWHPNIVGCEGYYMIKNELCILMNYAEGGSLHNLVVEQQGKFLPEKLIIYYFAQLAMALRFIHSKRILHRDLKTPNILMNRKKTIVMLGDFGISKQLSTITQASSLVGTPNYLSPEICEGQKYGPKADMWALGCVLFEMVELRRAFEGELPMIFKNITTSKPGLRVNKNMSKDVDQLIKYLLATDPKQRLDADQVVSYPCILRTCIDLSLDLGRVENKEIEALVNENIFTDNSTTKIPRSLPATLTFTQQSTLSATQPTALLNRLYTIQGKH
ncbi:Protein kinase domain-containing protein [Aphelenchoides bicaudatus]|nr:Protein kinase domain-containing protein [Aphelenchoides bicaudatus]